MVFIRYVVYVYNMALKTNVCVVLLIFGLKSDLVNGVRNTCAFPDVPLNSELTQSVKSDHVFQDGDVVKYQCNDGFSISGDITIRCTDGQWTNVGFFCDKKCDTTLLAHTKVFNADETRVKGLLESGISYKVTCETVNYVFEEYPDLGYIESRCEDGSFQNASSCIERPCTLFNTDENLQFRNDTQADHIPIPDGYIVQHDAKVFVSCKSDYELYNTRTDIFLKEKEKTITCDYGNMGEIPKCAEQRCEVHIPSDGDCYHRHLGANKCIRKSFNVRSGEIIYVKCEKNHTLEQINAKANDRTGVHGSMNCSKGKLSPQYRCSPDPCQQPELSNAATNYTNTNVTSGDTIVFTCVERHHMSGTTNKRTWEGKCKSGTIKNVPAGCIQDNCEKPIEVNGHFKIFDSQTVITDQVIQHGTKLQLECFDEFTIVDSNNEIVNNTSASIQCDRGVLLDSYQCKRCRSRQGSDNSSADINERNTTTSANHPENTTCDEYWDNVNVLETSEAGVSKDCTISESHEISKFTYIGDDGNEIIPPIRVMDGIQIAVECKYDASYLKEYYDESPTENIICVNGTLGYVSLTCPDFPANCTIPESSKYTYTDHEGNEIIPLESVMNGRQITVECKSDLYIYESYDVTETENITCVDGKLDAVSMVCEDSPVPAVQFDPCQKFELKNGEVTRNAIGEYYILCGQGYTLNLPKAAHEKPCNCSEGELVCFAGQKPVCKADACEIPYDIDRRLSVYIWSRRLSSRVGLFEGDKIRDEKYVYFNCSNVIEQKYEPANRRFQCVRGKWMEAERSPAWKLNNNGKFPECREANCVPYCKNGGVCFRDGECKCKHMTTGVICETFLCDESCAKNGGECVSPGKCGNCPTSRRGDNCEIEKICELPSNAAIYEDKLQKVFSGESIFRNRTTCAQGYTLSSVKVMTCQDDGTWTDIIRCRKTDFKYLVRIQTSDKWNAGTGNNVDVRINGHDEHTATFRMNGDFGRNKLVENKVIGTDIRPIQTVVVSKDSGKVYDDNLSILYVSIFIEESDDYYVFTKDDKPVWLTASTPVEFSISRHPERCIHTYGEAMNRSPKPDNRGKAVDFMSRRECKQRCATTRSLPCKSIYFMPSATDERGFGHCYHYTHSPDSNYFRDNTVEQTRRLYVSYKRICREP